MVNPRPLTVTRIYEKKVILKNAEAAAALAREEELSDKKEKINVYKGKYCKKNCILLYLSKQMPISE